MDSSLVLLVLLVWGQFFYTAHAALHEGTMFYGCHEFGDCQVQMHWDGDQAIYADFKKGQAVWTAPLLEELKDVLSSGFYVLALVSKERLLKHYLSKAMQIDRSPTEEKAPTVLIYPMEETEQGEENTLYCYISHFYPPSANITWTKNGVQVTEGVALSNLHPETDGTFSQLASLSFHPETDDVLGCSVQHQALSRPVTKTWEVTADGKYFHILKTCQFVEKSSQCDVLYQIQYQYNGRLQALYNSSTEKVVGFTEYGKVFADIVNNDTHYLRVRRNDLNYYCKIQADLIYRTIQGKAVPPVTRLKTVRSGSGGGSVVLVCSAYNFYPRQIRLSWLRDGVPIPDPPEYSEVVGLPLGGSVLGVGVTVLLCAMGCLWRKTH